jgi:hypothetical protein
MSACENLPQELIAAIADNIRDDKTALKAFSLVCRAWSNAAREHLFANLTIDKPNIGRMRNANFTSTYTPSSAISAYSSPAVRIDAGERPYPFSQNSELHAFGLLS